MEIPTAVLTFSGAMVLHGGMARFYFRHCGSLHPVSDDMVLGDDGEPLRYHPLVVCPSCRRVCLLSVVVDMESDNDGA